MGQKRVSFKVAKAIKEAGYWDPNTTLTSQYNNPCYAKNEKLYENGCICDWEDIFPAPTYLDVWLWLWKSDKWIITLNLSWTGYALAHVVIDGDDVDFKGCDQEEAIVSAIDYLVDFDLIKYCRK